MVDNQIGNGLIGKQNTKKQGCENAKTQNAKMWKCKSAKMQNAEQSNWKLVDHRSRLRCSVNGRLACAQLFYAMYSPCTAQCTHMLYLSTISRWRKMDLRTAEVPGWMQVGLPGAAPDAVGDAAHRRPLLSHRTRGLWCSTVIMPDMPGWECGAAMPWTRK